MANINPLHIRLFGNLSISTPNSQPAEIPATRAGALLAVLAIGISTNRAFPREEIIDLLWPEDDADVSRNKLRQTLYDVRRMIARQKLAPDTVLIATRNSLQLCADCVTVDAAIFEAELSAAARALDPSIRAERLAAAVELYKGELLPGFYQDRFITEKTRLEEAYHGALKSLALAYEETEQYDRGIECGRKLLALNPLNEEAHFTLMRLYAATGQPSLVLRQYQNLERTLKDELDEEPSMHAQEVMESLRVTALARTTGRGVGPTPGPGQIPDTEVIAALFPTSCAATVSAAEHSPMTSDQRSQQELQALRRSKRRWSLAAMPPAVLCLMMLALISVKRHNNAPKAIIPHVQPTAASTTHASVFARYQPAADERDSEPTAMTADLAGNLYVAGFVQTTHADVDYLTLKYDRFGHLLWRRRYDGTGNDVDRLRCIAVDAGGNVYVTGESDNGNGNGSSRLSGLDVVTIKYDSNGKELWQDRYNDLDNGDDRPVKMLLDTAGNAYVLCNCLRLRKGKDSGSDFVLIKYSPALKRLWVRRVDGGVHGNDVPTGMALMYKDSGVCVCGFSRANYKSGPEYDFVTMKYSADGDRLWMSRYGANNQADDYARDVFSDKDGNVFVVGEGRGLPGTLDETRTGCIMVKYNPAGDLLWARGTDKELDRLQRITAVCFWTDGSLAVGGPVINQFGAPSNRVVLRDPNGETEQCFETFAPFSSGYAGPCALVNWPGEPQVHDGLYMVGSRAWGGQSQLEFIVANLSPHVGLCWQEGFSPANEGNSAKAAVLYGHFGASRFVVAGQCWDKSGIRGIVLVKYSG